MSIRAPLGRVRGLGSAKDGVKHFWLQRMTAVALVPLVLWFLASIIAFAGASYDETIAYLSSPVVAVLFSLLIGAGFYHGKLGLQVVIEDYIHAEGTKIALILLVNFAAVAFAALAIFSILKIALSN